MSKLRKSTETLQRQKGPLGLLLIGLLAVLPFVIAGSSVVYGAHLENNDAFCASCHTEPESTFVGRAQSAASKTGGVQDLAAFHAAQDQAVKCIECHSGDGLSGRVDAMKLGARDLRAYVSGNFPQPSPLTHAIADINCIKCHQNYAADQSFNNHFHFLLARWRQVAGDNAATCVDCHASHAQDGQANIAFLNQEHTVALCNACHRVIGD